MARATRARWPGKPAASTLMAAVMSVGGGVLQSAPEARAEETVTYEVVSESVRSAVVEYQSVGGRERIGVVALPWRMDIPVRAIRRGPPDGAQVRADWRPNAAPNRWVSVRVLHRGELICQNTLDIGNAACYGIVPHVS